MSPKSRNGPKKIEIDVQKAMEQYKTGKYTIEMIAKEHGVSAGTMYYRLRDAECEFKHTRRKEKSQDEWLHRSLAHKGKIITEAQRKAISEKNSCNYNGLNGFGHTKLQNGGYVLAYVPKASKGTQRRLSDASHDNNGTAHRTVSK